MRLLQLRPVAPLSALFALFCFAAPASAEIKPFESIAGFELGLHETTVREQLGEPSSVREGPVVGQRTLVYSRRKLEFTIVGDSRVGAITTLSRSHRTPQDVGVGTGLRTLRAKLRGERCTELRRHTLCSVVRRSRVMDYIVVRARVKSVSLSGS
jgi:hypothetical protein